MKLLHISDLHLGKKLKDIDLIPWQKKMLDQILHIAKENSVQAILISGDVFDQIQVSNEASDLFHDFLARASSANLQIYAISGNHDSVSRLDYGSRLFELSQVYIFAGYQGSIPYMDLENADGKPIRLHFLPYTRLCDLQHYLDPAITDFESGLRQALSQAELLEEGFNILLSHQFYTNTDIPSIGGEEALDSHLLDQFDYAALGHIHKPIKIADHIYYCGSPLKYSIQEFDQQKGIMLLDVADTLKAEKIELNISPDFRLIEEEFDRLIDPDFYETINREDYLSIHLTDREKRPAVLETLSNIYPHLVEICYSQRLAQNGPTSNVTKEAMKDPISLITQFYEEIAGKQASSYQKSLIETLWKELDDETA